MDTTPVRGGAAVAAVQRYFYAPVAELKALRESCWQQQNIVIADGAGIVLPVAGDTLEIIAECIRDRPGGAALTTRR